MRRTTTSRAISCSRGTLLLAAALTAAACGKRGDPLPPLRPVPAVAEAVTLRQVGDRILLEWRAPSANHDGTTENLELASAYVLRRVLDLDAIVKAQSVPVKAKAAPAGAETPLEEEGVSDSGASVPPGPETPPEEAPPPEPAPVVEREQEPQTALESQTKTAPDSTVPAPAPEAPARPLLAFPPFEAEAIVVATLDSPNPGGALSFEENIDPEWAGKRVEYSVRHANRKKRVSPLAAVLAIDPREALPPPGAPRAEAKDGFVALHWSAPADAAPELSFVVYRRPEAAEAYPDAPLEGTPTREMFFEDRAVSFGVPTCYVVTTIWIGLEAGEPAEEPRVPADETAAPTDDPPVPSEPDAEPVASEDELTDAADEEVADVIVPIVPPLANPAPAESLPSEELCLTPVDSFAPPTPEAVVAVPSSSGILLTWREVQAPDLKGYRIYRGTSATETFQLLTEVAGTSYTDESALVGSRYFYFVTAIDGAPSTNESRRSELAEAVRPE